MFEKNMKSAAFFTAVLIFAFVFIFVIQGVEYGAVEPGDPEDEVSETEETDKTGEVYTASAEGYGGELTVDVEIADNEIVDVKIVEHSETDDISDPAIEKIPAAIVENQSTDVDTASGATVTSEAIIEAVSKALEEAEFDSNASPEEDDAEEEVKTIEGVSEGYGGDLVVEVGIDADNNIVEVNVVEHSETDDISDPAIEKIPAAIVESQSPDVDIASGATVTSEAIMEAVATALDDAEIEPEADSGEESDQESAPDEEDRDETRVVEGVGEGYGGDIVVEVELGPEDEIKAINIIDHDETDDFSDPAFEEIPSAIIDAQSTEVDVASGATMTSEGIIEAVEDAIE
ncbi:MAG: FMN-binding protein [Bacillota bacterium]